MNQSWNDQHRSTTHPEVVPIPYGFDAVDSTQAIHDAPAWRDGSGTEKRLSGELLITLEALTPLIVGNQQSKNNDQSNVLVPQMLEDGRVILGGASIKGMLRSAIASLLHAPMERVQEHHYTYRPNLAGPNSKKEMRVAVVLEHQLEKKLLKVAILEKNGLDASNKVVYLPKNIWKALKEPKENTVIKRTCKGLVFSSDNKENFRRKIEVAYLSETQEGVKKQDKDAKIDLDHTVLLYKGGIDGEGIFANAFDGGKTYSHVLFPTDILNNAKEKQPISVDARVVEHYKKTQEVLRDDIKGHLMSGHPLLSGNQPKIDKNDAIIKINNNTELQSGQLIYAEYDPFTKTITSFGHHYMYRWAYTSSTTQKAGIDRADQNPTKSEARSENGSPQQLTATRLFFGYALDKKTDALGEGNFKRLAGRISFNHAVEVPGEKGEADRFVNKGDPITLKVLGQPRPSAVEFYLKQGKLPNQLTTYGDLPADPGGDLAGRKHYRHQPDARQKIALYQAPAQSRGSQGQKDSEVERGTTVRYLSKPGSTFKTTLRFDSLRPWELGALLLALQPQRAKEFKLGIPDPARGYAHKLGYGKPLGLGSVSLAVDGARWQQTDSWQWHQCRAADSDDYRNLENESLTALEAKLQATWGNDAVKKKLLAWLQPREWKSRGYADYPVGENGKIFTFHADLRKIHAAARRGENKKKFDNLKSLLDKKP